MLCPKCNKELPDGSAFCNHCGCRIGQAPAQNNNQPPRQPQKSMQQIGAEAELKQLKSISWIGQAIILFIIGVALIVGGIYFRALIVAGLGIGIIVYEIVKWIDRSERIKKLEKLASGKRIIHVCPECKSPKIQMNIVQTNSVTVHGTTRVADNVNPLHPFTHTNIRQGNEYTASAYGNMMVCLNCGCTFTEPDKFYM